MGKDPDDTGPGHSRRDMFKLAGAVTALAGVGTAQAADTPPATPMPRREALENLTATEAAILEAFCARLIPSDANGPGALEARAAHYIDRSLGGALASSRELYRSGLMALDAQAQSAKDTAFIALDPQSQDAVLTAFEKSDAAFFNLVRQHTLQGTFCDPYYGGNANFVGWDMLAYPGIRLAVSERDEAMAPHLTQIRKSAYDFAMFDRNGAAIAERKPAPIDREHMPNGMGDMKNDN